MRWRRDWPERQPRPKARSLAAVDRDKILRLLTRAMAASPVLSGLGVLVRALRGRFYLGPLRPGQPDIEVWGRITPLADTLLLEVERRSGNWSEVARGLSAKLVKAVASDKAGTFHGLGSLDQALRERKQGLTRQPVTLAEGVWVYADSGEFCRVPEVLFHRFGLPLDVIAEPAAWYRYRRTPRIVEAAADGSRVLVRFGAVSGSGEHFGGTCLYALREGDWGTYTIRPSESDDIKSAEKWLVKRKWQGWC